MSRLKDVMLQFAVPGLAESADVSATPFGLGPLGGLTGLSNLGFGSANFMDLQQKMMREVCAKPLHFLAVQPAICPYVVSLPVLCATISLYFVVKLATSIHVSERC